MMDWMSPKQPVQSSPKCSTFGRSWKSPVDGIPAQLSHAWRRAEASRRVPVEKWRPQPAMSSFEDSPAQAARSLRRATSAPGIVPEGSAEELLAAATLGADVQAMCVSPSLASSIRRAPSSPLQMSMSQPRLSSATRAVTAGGLASLRTLSATSLADLDFGLTGLPPAEPMLPVRLAEPASGARRPALSSATGTATGCLQRSERFVEWIVPREAIEARCMAEEKAIALMPLVSPAFELLGEPCTLKFWPRGRRAFRAIEERCRKQWAMLGLFALRPSTNLQVRLTIGPRDRPWADSGTRRIFFDGSHTHPEQFLEANGIQRPFEWDELPEGQLHLSVEVFENCYDPSHHHARARRRRSST
eukprot:TRINITY_DN52386_c0_g1_i1.p1 TRINITY_DN52386_c0_g1~~TRINITY_DN52386_c0_g1_i1.p1  ORF type:complete len:360 (-),score=56.23 TRINITY_DN52386_c0_g1_i1:49-1128(-)